MGVIYVISNAIIKFQLKNKGQINGEKN